MTEDHDFKAIVRARMARTGESYMEALRHLRATPPTTPLGFERFTDRARRALVVAQEEARALGAGALGIEHVALALVADEAGVAGQVLTRAGLTVDRLRDAIGTATGDARADGDETQPMPFSDEAKKVLEFALREALQLGHTWIGTEHLLLALLRDDAGPTARWIAETAGPIDELRDRTLGLGKLAAAASALPVNAANDRLTEAIRCLPDPLRGDAEAARKATIAAALDDAWRRASVQSPEPSAEELQVHYEDVPAAFEAARAVLADLGVLRFVEVVEELQKTQEWKSIGTAERSLVQFSSEVLHADPEERAAAFARVAEFRRSATSVVAAAWAEVFERHRQHSPEELRAVLAEAAGRIAAIPTEANGRERATGIEPEF